MVANRCLICYALAGDRQAASCGHVLVKQLSVMFVLRVLFRIPTESLETYLEIGGGDGPESWIWVCGECEGIVDRAKESFEKVVAASRRFKAIQGEVVEKVRLSWRTSCDGPCHQGGDNIHERHVYGEQGIGGTVTDESREFATEFDYGCLHDPFTRGDELAARWLEQWNNANESTMVGDEDAGLHCGTQDDASSMEDLERGEELTEGPPEHEASNEFPMLNSNDTEPPAVMNEDDEKPKSFYRPAAAVMTSKEYDPGSKRLAAGNYKCHYCHMVCGSKTNLMYHVERVHEKICAFFCEYCGQARGSKQTLTMHQVDEHGVCSVEDCRQEFLDDRDMLRKHQLEAHGREIDVWACGNCGDLLVQKYRLQRHLQRHQRQEQPLGRDTVSNKKSCPHCDKMIGKYELAKHIKTVHEKVYPFYCDICGYGSRSKARLWEHQAAIHGLCSVEDCRLRFPGDMHKLRNHQLEVHGREVDVRACGECGKLFAWQRALKYHLLAHERRRKSKEGNGGSGS